MGTQTHTAAEAIRSLLAIRTKRPGAWAQAVERHGNELRAALDALTGTDEGDPAAT